jgi:serine/threonine-protein phosphatase 2A regulatory subunit B''
MGFEDFVWFLLCEEDKTTETSVCYWFRIIDLDNDGIISIFEIEQLFNFQVF